MSATYRIEMRRDPHSMHLPWDAVVYRLSDDERVTVVVGPTAYAALQEAREWVRDEENAADYVSTWDMTQHFVDDQGRDAEAPQSVRI
jgi:hypothetical protein